MDVDSGDVRSVSDEKGAWSVMCVSHDLIIAQHASPTQTPRMVSSLHPPSVCPILTQVVGVASSDMSCDITWTEICEDVRVVI